MKKKCFTNDDDQHYFLTKNWWTKSHYENVSVYKTSTLNPSYLSIFVQNKFMRMMKGTSLVEDSKKWQQGHIIYHF